jgi:hypothetical protein
VNLLARPHVLALPLVAAWGTGLIAARDRGGAPPLGLAALMTAWVNMHAGFIFGLIFPAKTNISRALRAAKKTMSTSFPVSGRRQAHSVARQGNLLLAVATYCIIGIR